MAFLGKSDLLDLVNHRVKGSLCPPKVDEFSENLQRGGSLPIQIVLLLIFVFLMDILVARSKDKM